MKLGTGTYAPAVLGLLSDDGVVVGHVGGGVLEVDPISQIPIFAGLLPSPEIMSLF